MWQAITHDMTSMIWCINIFVKKFWNLSHSSYKIKNFQNFLIIHKQIDTKGKRRNLFLFICLRKQNFLFFVMLLLMKHGLKRTKGLEDWVWWQHIQADWHLTLRGWKVKNIVLDPKLKNPSSVIEQYKLWPFKMRIDSFLKIEFSHSKNIRV